MKSLTILILFFALVKTYPQTFRPGYVLDIILFPQGFGIERLNSDGTSGVLNNVSNISGMNPASINQFPQLSFGLSYQFQSTIPNAYFLIEPDIGRVYNYLPQSFGGVVHYNNFCFGLSTGQRYNGNVDIHFILAGPIGEVSDYVTDFNYKQMLQYYSLITNYKFDNIFLNNSSLSIGLKYNLNRFSETDEAGSLIMSTVLWGSNFEAGLQYDYAFSDQSYLIFGFSYLNKLNMDGYFESENESLPETYPPPGPIYYNISGIKTTVHLPPELNVDILYQPVNFLKFAGSVKNVYWNAIDSGVKNLPVYSLSGIYSAGNLFDASLGYYYSAWKLVNNVFGINDDEMEADYITAGFSINLRTINLDFAIADSHLFSGGKQRRTIAKIGIGVHF